MTTFYSKYSDNSSQRVRRHKIFSQPQSHNDHQRQKIFSSPKETGYHSPPVKSISLTKPSLSLANRFSTESQKQQQAQPYSAKQHPLPIYGQLSLLSRTESSMHSVNAESKISQQLRDQVQQLKFSRDLDDHLQEMNNHNKLLGGESPQRKPINRHDSIQKCFDFANEFESLESQRRNNNLEKKEAISRILGASTGPLLELRKTNSVYFKKDDEGENDFDLPANPMLSKKGSEATDIVYYDSERKQQISNANNPTTPKGLHQNLPSVKGSSMNERLAEHVGMMVIAMVCMLMVVQVFR